MLSRLPPHLPPSVDQTELGYGSRTASGILVQLLKKYFLLSIQSQVRFVDRNFYVYFFLFYQLCGPKGGRVVMRIPI